MFRSSFIVDIWNLLSSFLCIVVSALNRKLQTWSHFLHQIDISLAQTLPCMCSCVWVTWRQLWEGPSPTSRVRRKIHLKSEGLSMHVGLSDSVWNLIFDCEIRVVLAVGCICKIGKFLKRTNEQSHALHEVIGRMCWGVKVGKCLISLSLKFHEAHEYLWGKKWKCVLLSKFIWFITQTEDAESLLAYDVRLLDLISSVGNLSSHKYGSFPK